MTRHAIDRLSGLPDKPINVLAPEFTSSMVAPMDGQRISFRITLEDVCHCTAASPPVPRDESNACREVVVLHKSQEVLIIQEPVLRPEQRIIQYNARIIFGRRPGCVTEGPFDIHDDRQ